MTEHSTLEQRAAMTLPDTDPPDHRTTEHWAACAHAAIGATAVRVESHTIEDRDATGEAARIVSAAVLCSNDGDERSVEIEHRDASTHITTQAASHDEAQALLGATLSMLLRGEPTNVRARPQNQHWDDVARKIDTAEAQAVRNNRVDRSAVWAIWSAGLDRAHEAANRLGGTPLDKKVKGLSWRFAKLLERLVKDTTAVECAPRNAGAARHPAAWLAYLARTDRRCAALVWTAIEASRGEAPARALATIEAAQELMDGGGAPTHQQIALALESMQGHTFDSRVQRTTLAKSLEALIERCAHARNTNATITIDAIARRTDAMAKNEHLNGSDAEALKVYAIRACIYTGSQPARGAWETIVDRCQIARHPKAVVGAALRTKGVLSFGLAEAQGLIEAFEQGSPSHWRTETRIALTAIAPRLEQRLAGVKPRDRRAIAARARAAIGKPPNGRKP